MLGMVMCACYSDLGEEETGGAMGPTGQLSIIGELQSNERP